MQYPAEKRLEFSTGVLRCVDGTEQRYREYSSAARRWVIRLERLDESELRALEEFFVAEQGQFGSFTFTDPWDGTEHADCSLEDAELDIELTGEMSGRTSLVVRENRT